MRFALCATQKRKNMKSLKTILLYSLLTIILIGTIYYIKLPSYTINSSTNMSASNYVETSLDVQVYKEFGGKSFYEEIEWKTRQVGDEPLSAQLSLSHRNLRLWGADGVYLCRLFTKRWGINHWEIPFSKLCSST